MNDPCNIDELDTVQIPEKLSDELGLSQIGTVVAAVKGAPIVTVECFKLKSERVYGESVLLDIPISCLLKLRNHGDVS